MIFARCAPKQKEFIIVNLKSLGYTTLMCGDGTNDVGALKHAQVGKSTRVEGGLEAPSKREYAVFFPFLSLSTGVAILSSPPERPSEKREDPRNDSMLVANGPRANTKNTPMNSRTKLHKILKDIDNEVQEQVIVKLGDASIAAPFTSKMSSIQCSKTWRIIFLHLSRYFMLVANL